MQMSATESTWAAFSAQENRLVAQAQGARLDADYWKAACQQWQDKAQALEHAKASMAQQVENLKSTLRGVYMNHDAYKHKAAVLDHVLSADDSTMVLCRATYNDRARRWSFAPLCSIEEARQVMEADLAAADEDEAECSVCLGTGEGAHEGTSCAACGGRGY